MAETQIRAFFGDGEHDMCLTPPMIFELERVTDRGIGAIFNRLITREFGFSDIVETIRLGLIGGGMDPKRAFEMVETYVKPRPVVETFPVAFGIVDALWRGNVVVETDIEANAAVAEEARADG